MISFGEDLNTQKVSFGDEIKSVNGTYSGTVIGFTTEGASQQSCHHGHCSICCIR